MTSIQAIMNKLLKDFINIGKVGSFINDIMVGMESEKEHDELVEEILRRLEENDLYMKLEKYKCKGKSSIELVSFKIG